MRSQLKREMNDLRGAEDDYMLARAEEAKARKVATANPEPFKQARGKDETRDTRGQADQDIEKFNMLVVADSEHEQKTRYQRQSRGKVQNINTPVDPEPMFVLTYYERAYEVSRPVYYSEIINKANGDLNLAWVLKATNNEAALNELQIQTHFRSIDNYSMRIESDPVNPSLFFGRAMDFMLVQDYENALKDLAEVISLKTDMPACHFARATVRSKQMEYERLQNDPRAMTPGTGMNLNELSNIAGKPRLPEISTRSIDYEEILKEYEKIIRINPILFMPTITGQKSSAWKRITAQPLPIIQSHRTGPQFAEAYSTAASHASPSVKRHRDSMTCAKQVNWVLCSHTASSSGCNNWVVRSVYLLTWKFAYCRESFFNHAGCNFLAVLLFHQPQNHYICSRITKKTYKAQTEHDKNYISRRLCEGI